jgi:hypothetical protein
MLSDLNAKQDAPQSINLSEVTVHSNGGRTMGRYTQVIA